MAQSVSVGLPSPSRVLLAHRLFQLAAAALLIYTTIHFIRAWYTGDNLGQSSGIVLGQAMDLADGVFYRPIVSDRGIGGTRYMPLPFLLMAPFIKLGFDPINTAYALTLLTNIALLAGTYLLMRRLGVESALAAPAATLVFAAASGQYAATTIRNDLLPATLNVWGLAFACTAGDKSARPRPVLAALFFVLAFTAKIAALFGVTAAVLAFLLSRQWKNAILLSLLVFLGIVLSLTLIHFASDGRFLENMLACATGGAERDGWNKIKKFYVKIVFRRGFGLDWTATLFFVLAAVSIFRIRWNSLWQALLAPVLLIAAYQSWTRDWLPFSLAAGSLILAFLLIFRVHWTDWRETPIWAFLITAAVILGLFTSPGISHNVFLDFHIIALVFFVLQIARRRLPYIPAILALSAIAAVSIFYLVAAHRDKGIGRDEARQILASIGPGPKPFLCKPPMLHIYAGEVPYVLDPWMFRHMKRYEELSSLLCEKIKAEQFRAVMVGDLEAEAGEEGTTHQFGPNFVEILTTYYVEVSHHTDGRGRVRFQLYKPQSQVPQTRPVPKRRPAPQTHPASKKRAASKKHAVPKKHAAPKKQPASKKQRSPKKRPVPKTTLPATGARITPTLVPLSLPLAIDGCQLNTWNTPWPSFPTCQEQRRRDYSVAPKIFPLAASAAEPPAPPANFPETSTPSPHLTNDP